MTALRYLGFAFATVLLFAPTAPAAPKPAALNHLPVIPGGGARPGHGTTCVGADCLIPSCASLTTGDAPAAAIIPIPPVPGGTKRGTAVVCEGAACANPVIYSIKPKDIDPTIKAFNAPNIVEYYPLKAGPKAQLAIYFPGTNGRPDEVPGILDVIAQQGYRVIGLEYDDNPAVTDVCPQQTYDTQCAAQFRWERLVGSLLISPQPTPLNETILVRLVTLLNHLNRTYPGDGWGQYLLRGQPNWSRIVVSGLSQGAGMAAFIAKKYSVARVVLFSSPWDYVDAHDGMAEETSPWVGETSATPVSLWHAEYHRCEKNASRIQRAYALAAIPQSHIMVFDLSDAAGTGGDKFHTSTTRDPRYTKRWRELYGVSP